jgi:hypothetical protein
MSQVGTGKHSGADDFCSNATKRLPGEDSATLDFSLGDQVSWLKLRTVSGTTTP